LILKNWGWSPPLSATQADDSCTIRCRSLLFYCFMYPKRRPDGLFSFKNKRVSRQTWMSSLCSITRTGQKVSRYTFFWEMLNDPQVRTQLTKNGGLCSDHLHLVFEERPSVLGIAIIFKDLLLHYLRGELPAPENTRCHLCLRNRELERESSEILKKYWSEWKREWGKYTFLCRQHLCLFPPEDEISKEICSFSEKALYRILELVNSFIEKFDHRKATSCFSEFEKESWQYLLEFFASKTFRKIR